MNDNNLNANNGMGVNPQPNVNPQVPTDNLGINQNDALNSVQPTAVEQPVVTQQEVAQPVVEQTEVAQTLSATPEQPVVTTPVSPEINAQSVTPEEVAQTNVAPESSASPLGAPIQPAVEGQQPSVAATPLQNTTTSDATITPNNTLNQMNNTGSSFVPTGNPVKKNNKLPIIIAIVAVLLVVVGVVVVFFVKPKVQKEVLSDPKNVYEATINNLSKEINTVITDANYEKGIFDLTLSLDSDIEMLKNYIGYEYGVSLGVDPGKELFELGASVKKDNELSLNAFYKNKKLYANLSTYQELIDLGEVDVTEFEDLFAELEEIKATIDELNISKEDITYLVTKFSSLLVESIDTSKLTQEKETIKLNGKELEVVNNKYLIDYDNAQRTAKFIIEEIAKDNKVLEIFSKISGEEKDDIKESLLEGLDELSENEVDEETKKQKMYISIYTYGNKNDIIGYSCKDDIKEMYMYSVDGNFEILIPSESYDFEEEKEVISKMIITGTKNGDVTDVVIKVDDTKIAELTVREFTAEKVDFDYTIILDEEMEIKGYVKYSANANGKKDKYNLEVKVNVPGLGYVTAKLGLTLDWESEVSDINVSNAKVLDETEMQNVLMNFLTALEDTPIWTLFETLGDTGDDDVYYDDDDFYDDDYYMNDPELDY